MNSIESFDTRRAQTVEGVLKTKRANNIEKNQRKICQGAALLFVTRGRPEKVQLPSHPESSDLHTSLRLHLLLCLLFILGIPLKQ